MRLWRIASAFYPVWSSEGARLKGGRWSQTGTPAIYAATSYASAVLEVLVHGNIGRVPRGFRYVLADIPDDVRIDTIGADTVPGWDSLPPDSSRAFGNDWLGRREALVLLVPSVVTNGLDQNAVVNPLHPDFARIAVGEEQPVRWDARLLIAVGTRITARPPHRTVRAAFPHTAPTLGV